MAGTGINITGTATKTISVDPNLSIAWANISGVSVSDSDLAASAKQISIEYSSNNIDWNTTRSEGDIYYRFNVAGGTYSDGISQGVSSESVTQIVQRYIESHDLAGPHVCLLYTSPSPRD